MNKSNFIKRRLFKTGRWLLVLMALLSGVNSGFCGDSTFTEYQVKALFLMNFTKYVEWPATAFATNNTPFTIGVYGENNFGDNLRNAVAGKKVGSRSIVIRQVDGTNDMAQCQILFISGSEKKNTGDILDMLKVSPVLTVGETEQFTGQGGIINFVKKDGKVRLEINLQAAQQANLQISSKLLSVADVVKGKPK